MNDNIKILHVVNKWEKGGTEKFVEELAKECGKFQTHQSILSICTSVTSDVDCIKFGPLHPGEGMRAILRGALKLDRFLEMHSFDVIHIHTQNSSGFLYAAIAKRHDINCRVIHSHNSSLGPDSSLAKRAAQNLLRKVFGGEETARLACSTEAGRHLFQGNSFIVVPNGVNIKKFAFDPQTRIYVRNQLGIAPETLLVGCVGSLIKAKNNRRSIEILNELVIRNPNTHMVFLGDGPLRQSLEEAVQIKGLKKKVSFLGFVENPAPYYNAMDVILFPSLFEGLPISLIEAQCNGLPVISSDAVTKEVALLESFVRVPLSASNDRWVDKIIKSRRSFDSSAAQIVSAKGFSKETTAKTVLAAYQQFGEITSDNSAERL